MKKLPFLTLILVASGGAAFAQKTNSQSTNKPLARMEVPTKADGAPRITIGTIESATTSREKVLAYPRLLAQELNCDVLGFSFSISNGTKSWGPFEVTGAVFPEQVMDKIKDMEAPPKVKITIDNIKVKCNGGTETAAAPITVEYDH